MKLLICNYHGISRSGAYEPYQLSKKFGRALETFFGIYARSPSERIKTTEEYNELNWVNKFKSTWNKYIPNECRHDQKRA